MLEGGGVWTARGIVNSTAPVGSRISMVPLRPGMGRKIYLKMPKYIRIFSFFQLTYFM